MVRTIIYPYKMGSKSARALSLNLTDYRSKQVYPDGHYKHNWSSHLILNWGNSQIPRWYQDNKSHLWLNPSRLIDLASDKIRCLQILQRNNINVPEFTTNRQTAENWTREGSIIYCRTLTRASQGKGIVLATRPREIVSAPLYTKQLVIRGEYRVHIFNGQVIDYQKKRRREEAIENGDIGNNIRNINNGWVYCRNNLGHIQDNRDIAINTISVLGLNFGAVDIIRDINRISYVLEVNTAPGLEGLTLINYTKAIRKYIVENYN